MIDELKLLRLYELQRGVTTRIGSYSRTHYPTKTRTPCCKCEFIISDKGGDVNKDWCQLEFKTIVKKGKRYNGDKKSTLMMYPNGICIPVRSNNFISDLHAEKLAWWVVQNLEINRKQEGGKQ
jgi:hypothetical protein